MKEFEVGDEVIATDGPHKGYYGKVIEVWLGTPIVELGPDQFDHGVHVISAEFLEHLTPEEQVDEIPVYDFGIPADVLQSHLEWFVGRSLQRLGAVGPEQALFGFQEFEGKTPNEVILELMGKLEEGAALLAQTHILLGRIVMALESVHDQN